MLKIALQMYSLREQFEIDIDTVLEKISQAGYDGVETYTLFNMTADKLKEKLDKHGLVCMSMHVMDRDVEKMISDALVLGASYVAIPFSPWENETDGQDVVDFVKENAAKIRAAGLKWLYHNHSHEFKKHSCGADFFDVLLPNTGKDEINLQIDTYWVEQAGVPVEMFIKRAQDRIGCFHLKDEREIGAGKIDFIKVIKTAEELGHEWVIVEQEEFDIDPFESINISCSNVRKMICEQTLTKGGTEI